MFELHPQLGKDCHLVTELDLCRVLLLDDCQFPWLVLVPMIKGVKETIDLTDAQQQVLWQESAKVSHCLKNLYRPDKLNVAALGNMVPQLHVHHIARFTTDLAWPAPVWGKVPAKPYTAEHLSERLDQLKSGLMT